MTRLWFTLAGLVLFVGSLHVAYEWGWMDAHAEFNSAPSSVVMVYLLPYMFVSVLLLIPPLVSRHRKLNPRRRADPKDTSPTTGSQSWQADGPAQFASHQAKDG